jgi:glycosyltransferase involved in cell wall biosynthesis
MSYNHERYISDAITSILAQRTDFQYEIVIGDDCSTDETPDIIETYRRSNPETIRILHREKRLGNKRNFIDILANCRGEYIALLDGDDYWIDPYKLQKQVDFLEQHPEYVLVTNNAFQVYEEENFAIAHLINKQMIAFDFGTSELMVSNPCITLTVMFKNHLVTEFPAVYFEGTGADRRLFILLSLHGKCRYINDVTGVYRAHSASLTGSRASFEQQLAALQQRVRNAEIWNDYLGGEYSQEVELVRSSTAKNIVVRALQYRRLGTAIHYSRYVDRRGISSKINRLFVGLLQALERVGRRIAPA